MSEINRRRGIVLLVVLSLLVLFTILMVTFLIVAGQYRIAARATSRSRQQVIEPKELLEQAVFTLLRDTTNARSVIRGHSLLLDMYGLDGFDGYVLDSGPVGYFTGAADGTGGQFFDLRLDLTSGLQDPLNNAYTLQPLNGYYNGCVLTTVRTSDNSVGARSRLGLSYRIVGYSFDPTVPSPNNHIFRLMATSPDVGTMQAPLPGDTVIINGRPFNGTGFGYEEATTAMLWPRLSDDAILPNQYGRTLAQFTTYLLGDADEGYDAVDFQNLALAAFIPNAGAGTNHNVPELIMPSFHRPDLINYWRFGAPSSSWPALAWSQWRNRIVLRPMPWDHPDFTGSNSAMSITSFLGADGEPGVAGTDDDGNGITDRYPPPNNALDTEELGFPLSDDAVALLTGPWDVDNDGDGIKDSIWVDLDFPLQVTSDGRLLKPLFAFYCQDQDSRLNVNAHGSYDHIHDAALRPTRTTDTITLARGVNSNTLPKGSGNGPVEIYLASLLGTTPYQRLLQGDTQTGLRGRYGDDGQPGTSTMDLLTAVKFFEVPNDYFNNQMVASPTGKAYSSVPDLAGELAIGLDHRGQPTSDRPTANDSLTNNPYETNLSQDTSRGLYNPLLSGAAQANDQPYSVAELEAILRYYDVDVGLLPDRLVKVLNNSGTANPFTASSLAEANRRIVTTDSYDLPVPSIIAPPGRAADFEGNTTLFPASRPLHFMDFIRQRHFAALSITAPTAAQVTTLNNLLGGLVSPDLAMGLKMDLNRPFGNGADDNGNGVIDEHGPISTAQLEADPSVAEKIWSTAIFFDHDNDGNTTTDTDAYLARYHFARHLYVLAMTFKYKTPGGSEHNIDFENDGISGTASIDTFETARGLAQWAMNVVDFRDADSIMTPFEFDPNPFDGWSVDGDIELDWDPGNDGKWGIANVDDDGDMTVDGVSEKGTTGSDDIPNTDANRGVVWGCERPELLLSETLAFHDRRTEDLAVPNGLTTDDQGGCMIGETDILTGGPNDFDQRHRPRGYAYLELYNPWASDIERPPQEFYNGISTSSGVVLNEINGGGSPVWRVAVTQVPASDQDLDNLYSTGSPLTIERVVYFSTTGPAVGTATAHYATAGASLAPLLPGRYAVVGRTHTTFDFDNPVTGAMDATEYVALLGRRNDGTFNTDTTRRIVLHADGNADANWVFVDDNNETASWYPNGAPSNPNHIATHLPAVAVPMADFNVSEGSYPANDGNGVPFGTASINGEPVYTDPFDQPFDLNPAYSVDVNPATAAIDTLSTNGTYTSFRTVHLQRLANPLLAYDAITNPYLTIDAMPIDVTVYNGINRNSSGADDPSVLAGDPNFESRQRGVDINSDGDANPITNPFRNLWNPSTTAPGTTSAGAIAGHYLDEEFVQTLGRMNEPFGATFNWDFGTPANSTAPNQNFVGAPDSRAANPPNPPVDRGPPFPWLTWNNRPFVSQYELLWVPYQRSSKLLSNFTTLRSYGAYYNSEPPPGSNRPYAQFGHLLNLFESSGSTITTMAGMPMTRSSTTPGADLYWLLEYTHVPSRYLGAETWLNPSVFSTGTGTDLRHPPFNRISNFRDPGRVNPSNIFDDRVWAALLGPPYGDRNGPTFTEWLDSRRGYAGSGIVSPSPSVPTLFANPLRPVGYGHLVPLTTTMERTESECDLLRSTSVVPTTEPPGFSTGSIVDALYAKASDGDVTVDPTRNPYFRYQTIQRFANLVTPRSNVYSISITVGFFEVDPSTGQLRQEAGIETGQVERHRAMYIFDRTIPVAFEPGENHNVERAVLLKRFIE